MKEMEFENDLRKQLEELALNITDLDKFAEHSCFTDHTCTGICKICAETGADLKCKLPAHKSSGDQNEGHRCDLVQHDCGTTCQVLKCQGRCAFNLGHTDPVYHRCRDRHECREKCEFCEAICTRSMADEPEHKQHLCSQQKCTKTCILCKETQGNNLCCDENHGHDKSTEIEKISIKKICKDLDNDDFDLKTTVVSKQKEDEQMNVHLCGCEHSCPKLCEKPGVCHLTYRRVDKIHPTKNIPFEFVDYKRKIGHCSEKVRANKCVHDEAHNCGVVHKCTATCGQCGIYCDLPVGHRGDHSSTFHRNMVNCFVAAVTIDKPTTLNDAAGGSTTITYLPGEQYITETCSEHCKRLGRSHYHLKPCEDPNGYHGPGVRHCGRNERFFPDTDVVYDKYLCDEYWESVGWKPPLANDVASHRQKEFGLCDCACPHPDHQKRNETIYCTEKAWHSTSVMFQDHSFNCHSADDLKCFIDVVFCIDSTGSMARFVEQVNKAVGKIVNDAQKLNSESSIRFSIIGYRDHNCPETLLEPKNPVFFEAHDLPNHKVIASGCSFRGGATAALDALDAAVKLPWKDGSNKIIIHILDFPPHGSKFNPGSYLSGYDGYPNGCPCGLSEVDVLGRMKTRGIEYFMVPLTDFLEATINIFEGHIKVNKMKLPGEDLNAMALELPTFASQVVCKYVEKADVVVTVKRTK